MSEELILDKVETTEVETKVSSKPKNIPNKSKGKNTAKKQNETKRKPTPRPTFKPVEVSAEPKLINKIEVLTPVSKALTLGLYGCKYMVVYLKGCGDVYCSSGKLDISPDNKLKKGEQRKVEGNVALYSGSRNAVIIEYWK